MNRVDVVAEILSATILPPPEGEVRQGRMEKRKDLVIFFTAGVEGKTTGGHLTGLTCGERRA